MRSHPVLHWTWCTVVGFTGGTILLAGLVMSVTPGPGLAGILLGLAVLATEFAWARGVLRFARDRARRAKKLALERQRRRRARKRATTNG
ncbi:PGPGW domain-containing protein [Halostreptopolyspora alba]|uniref:TIGR02611 family protein n=1 Tax=Halostreptopolyspora alba TaxID=2487137 RepID=A0A3N0E2P8_9ACTN|nr:hypothetical protein EFW17_20385 [Nocardiopsaceae bacterium YIM 96095]